MFGYDWQVIALAVCLSLVYLILIDRLMHHTCFGVWYARYFWNPLCAGVARGYDWLATPLRWIARKLSA